jgi:uncharacterized protein DUF6962
VLFNESSTELTTAATDAAMAILCVVALARLTHLHVHARWKRTLWSWVLALLGLASVLGALAHGLTWSASTRAMLWPPLYVLLGLSVTLFLVGGIYDWRGEAAARRILPWAVGAGVGFGPLVGLMGGTFLIFIMFDTTAMLAALAIYGVLAARRRVVGAGLVTTGIALTIVAGAVQASHLSVQLLVPFDHNGLFHLVQLVATTILVTGLRRGLTNDSAGVPVAVREQGPSAV